LLSISYYNQKLEKLPKWRRYLDAFGGLTYAEEAMRGQNRRRIVEEEE